MSVSAVKTEAAPAEGAPPAAGKKSIAKLAVIAVLVLGVAGGGAYWHFSHKGGDAEKEVKHEPPKPPVYYALEQFTVNLVQVDAPQFLQTGISLKVIDAATVEELKLHLPVVRDRILMLMSSRKASELLSVEGKRALGEDITTDLNEILGAAPGKAKGAGHGDDAKGAEAKDEEEEEVAAKEEEGDDGKKSREAKKTKSGKGEEKKSATESERRVQAVLFTSFIIQ